MKTLADAWGWYAATKRNLERMRRLGRKHWNDPSLVDASIWKDDEFKMLEASDIVEGTTTSLKPIDNLAVVVLFSVFESQVRGRLADWMKPEAGALTDPILKQAAADAIQGVEEGSFSRRVLDPLKEQGHVSPDLVEQVSQIRKFRNWVAHGQRGGDAETNKITPQMAYDRLRNFLAVLGIAIESEQIEPEEPGTQPE